MLPSKTLSAYNHDGQRVSLKDLFQNQEQSNKQEVKPEQKEEQREKKTKTIKQKEGTSLPKKQERSKKYSG